MQTRKLPICHPVVESTWCGKARTWTEITCDPDELMSLLGMPVGTKLISIGSNAMTGVKITVEEPLEA